jgi:signal transduction histidine kinase
MRLEELLSELQVRLAAVLASRDRVHALLDAVVSMGSELDLETVLRRIVETATDLVDASYGALGVVGRGGGLIEFVPVGLTEEEIARIEHWPHGLGLLGSLIKDARPLRLARIADHPDSYGFPPGHPPMGTFLGVPIRVREEVFGNLYLTEKRGGGEFDEDDEAIVVTLATAAGVAVDNARLYERTRRREMWLRASSEITTSLLSGADPHDVLSTLTSRAMEMTDADVVELMLPDDAGRLVVEIAEGRRSGALVGTSCEVETSPAGAVFTRGRSLTEGDMRLLVPLGAPPAVRGVLAMTRRSGRLPFSTADERMLEAFAGHATIALKLAEARMDAERLSLLEDRDRIAKDLHDVVIQRLFAVAMTLMGAMRLIDRPEAGERVRHAVDELDETIRQIRSSIFALQGTGGDSLRGRIAEIVESAGGHLGFRPGLLMEGGLDTMVEPPVSEQVLAVLREALSNVVRHARASRADVAVEASGGWVSVVVTDNGVGVSPDGRRSGLANLEDRARQLGGTFTVESPEAGGTRLSWSVPL